MKSTLVKFIAVACLAIGQLAANVAFADGPGGGNGDDGTLMLAKAKQKLGADEFHTLLYAFEHGTALAQPSSWKGGIRFEYNAKQGLVGSEMSEKIKLAKVARGPLLEPIWQVCLLNGGYVSYSCTSETVQNTIEFKNNSLVTTFDFESSSGDYPGLTETRVYNGLVITLIRPNSEGNCRRDAVPKENICSIGYMIRAAD